MGLPQKDFHEKALDTKNSAFKQNGEKILDVPVKKPPMEPAKITSQTTKDLSLERKDPAVFYSPELRKKEDAMRDFLLRPFVPARPGMPKESVFSADFGKWYFGLNKK